MKKRIYIIFTILLLVIIVISSILIIKNNNDKKFKVKYEKRYDEIRESLKKAVEWNIKASYPKCPITNNNKEPKGAGMYYNSSFLINNGYIKKEELKDVDDKSYCDVYVKIDPYFEDPQDQMHNCETSYKIFLKCKNLTDKGYIDWGN